MIKQKPFKNLQKLWGGVIALFLLTVPMISTVSAQNSAFLLPHDPEADFGIHQNVENTGAGVCKVPFQGNNVTLSVMVWDGDNPGLGWDLDYGTQTGSISLADDVGIHDPDVVVYNTDPGILAHIVYELDDHIYYEIWQYDISSNSWSSFQSPTQLSLDPGGLNPNIDRMNNSIAVVWSFANEDIRGVTGNMAGNYASVESVYYDSGYNCTEPDVAISMDNNWNYYISVVLKKINGHETKVRVAKYEFSNFSYNGLIDTDLDLPPNDQYSTENDPNIEFGTPRIAAYDNIYHDIPSEWPYQVVFVENNSQSEYIVHGFNSWDASPNYSYLNEDDYESELDGGHYHPMEYPTKEPVVSYLEDINVAWAYKAPETGNWEIVYRRLENSTGEVCQTDIGGYTYSYFYSLVNGIDGHGWEEANQHHPCIASRFSVDEKVIGWFDDGVDQQMPEYKVRQTNTIIFDLEEEGDPGIIYPNPATKWLNIQLPDDMDEARIAIYSIKGEQIISEKINGNLNTIDISGINSGMYIAEIKLKEKTIQKKFIKQ